MRLSLTMHYPCLLCMAIESKKLVFTVNCLLEVGAFMERDNICLALNERVLNGIDM